MLELTTTLGTNTPMSAGRHCWPSLNQTKSQPPMPSPFCPLYTSARNPTSSPLPSCSYTNVAFSGLSWIPLAN